MVLVKRNGPPDSVLPASDEALNESSLGVILSTPQEAKAPKKISASVSQYLIPSVIMILCLRRIGLSLLLEPFYFL